MKFSKTSWHYRLFNKTYERGVPTNLCPYFWLLLLAIICFPFNFVWNLPAIISHLISKIFSKDGFEAWADEKYFGTCFLMSVVINFAVLCVVGMIGVWFHYNNTLFFVFGGIGYLIIFGIICHFLKLWLEERRKKTDTPYQYKEPKPSILVEFVKAKYKRYCPKIEWTSHNKK